MRFELEVPFETEEGYQYIVSFREFPPNQLDYDIPLIDISITLVSSNIETNSLKTLNKFIKIVLEYLEQNDVIRWGWQLNNQGWVNWPDNQHRIFRNKPEIKWVNKVHEKIVGWKTYADLPSEDDSYALYHIKDIDRQRKQNEFYSTL